MGSAEHAGTLAARARLAEALDASGLPLEAWSKRKVDDAVRREHARPGSGSRWLRDDEVLLDLHRALRSTDGVACRPEVSPRPWKPSLHRLADLAVQRVEEGARDAASGRLDQVGAYVEAVRRWGPRAGVETLQEGRFCIVGVYAEDDSTFSVVKRCGCGRTWEEAFEDAAPDSAVCVLVQRGLVLSISRRGDDEDVGFPGGMIDWGEAPGLAAARELDEEAGVSALRMVKLIDRVDEHEHLVRAYLVTQWVGEPCSREGQRVAWVPPERLLDGRCSFPGFNAAAFAAFEEVAGATISRWEQGS